MATKTCTICGEESKALHMHMKKHELKTDILKEGQEEMAKPVEVDKSKIVDTLMHRIPGLFDRHPQGSISRQGLEKLIDELF